MSPALFVIVLAYAVYVVWRLAATGGGGPEDANLGEILVAPFVVVVGVIFGVVLGLVGAIVGGFKQPPPRRASPPDAPCCGGVAGGCPVCLAMGVAGGVVIGSWLDGE